MKSGIYCIKNKTNQKCYVGASRNIASRLYNHKSALMCNRHINQYLQFSWNKYGQENFEMYVLEYCEVDLLAEKEQNWINDLGTLDEKYGYNLSSTLYGQLPETKTLSHKEAIGRSSKIKINEYYDRVKAEGLLQVVTIHFETLEKTYYSSKTELPFKTNRGPFNFVEKVFVTTTYNKTEEEIQQEFKAVQLRYQNYLKSQEKTAVKIRKRELEDYTHHYSYSTIFTSEHETLNFKCNNDAALYFGITPFSICTAVANKKYTVTTFYLVGQNGIINEAKDLKTLASQNNHNYNAYKKLMEGRYKTYLGHIIHRNDTVFEVQRLS